jgi:hypothetical protein
VTIGGVVGSGYNHDSYTGCQSSNVAEHDNRAASALCDVDDGPDDPETGCTPGYPEGLDVQLLVGFRVPVGSEGPEGSSPMPTICS